MGVFQVRTKVRASPSPRTSKRRVGGGGDREIEREAPPPGRKRGGYKPAASAEAHKRAFMDMAHWVLIRYESPGDAP